MNSPRWRALIQSMRPDLDRQQLIELVMTVGVIGMTFALVGLMILRLSANAEPVAQQPKLDQQPKAVSFDHSEVELGKFQVTMTTMKQLRAGHGQGNVHILQFSASVMVQSGTRTQNVKDAFKQYRGRLHATIDSATRSATEDELRDPGLDVLRGKIRTRVNRLLGDDVVDEVIVSDFRYYRL
jgi:hypothetical protein